MSEDQHASAFRDIVIGEIDDPAELRSVEELQKEVWGVPDLDVVPLSQLVAAKAAGGVLLGAYFGEELIGFVYGFVGWENGQVTHHSHMLAVKPSYRNFSVGYKLKLAQREFVLSLGITEMTWTFDPLQSLNAHFNFNRLGAISHRYLMNFYGVDAASLLHRNGTDRLWVSWQLTRQAEHDKFELENSKPLLEVGNNNEPIHHHRDLVSSENLLSIGIPTNIRSLEQQDLALAASWREATRSAFPAAFAAGYVAVNFVRGPSTGNYVLKRDDRLIV